MHTDCGRPSTCSVRHVNPCPKGYLPHSHECASKRDGDLNGGISLQSSPPWTAVARAAFASKVGAATAALSVCQRAHSINLTPAALTEKGNPCNISLRLDLLRRKVIFCAHSHPSFSFPHFFFLRSAFSPFSRAHIVTTRKWLCSCPTSLVEVSRSAAKNRALQTWLCCYVTF